MKKHQFLSILILLGAYKNVHAQPAALDQSFADNGIGIYSIPLQNTLTSARCSMQQADGKIILGVRMDGFAALVRINTDGSLDNSFGADGKILYAGSNSVAFYDGLVQPDGKIVVAGISATETLVLRYNANGSRDKSFDGDGEAIINFGSESSGRSVAIQTDGKIVVAGYVRDADNNFYAIARLNSNGSPDNNFDGDGKKQFSVSAEMDDIANSVFIQSTGKILIAGVSLIGSDYDFSVVRLKTDGSFDETFSGDGKYIFQLQTGTNDIAVSIAGTTDGKIVIGGYTGGDENDDFALTRLNDDGSFDNSFDGDGKAIIPVGTNVDIASEMTIQADGKILLCGYSYTSALSYDYSIVRVKNNGTLDNNFDGDGKQIISFSSDADFCYCMSLLSNGKIFLAGASGNPATLRAPIAVYQNYSAAQLNSNGSIDNSFDGDGKNIYATGNYDDNAYASGIDANGNIMLAGKSQLNSQYTVASAIKLKPNGNTNNNFDADGKVLFNTGGFFSINAIDVLPNGKTVFAGFGSASLDTSFIIGRLNNDGTPDNSFDGDGIVTVPVSGTSIATCIVRQTDGKILVGGYSTKNNNTKDFTIMRLSSTGVLDNTFDGDGIKTISFISSAFAYAITVQPDGKILLAGHAQTLVKTNPADFAVARINSDGSTDNSFGTSGKTIINIGATDNCYAMKLQSDGKIVLGGASKNSTSFDFAAVRLTTSGALDKTFNKTGTKVIAVGAEEDIAKGIAIQTDGKIILGGYSLSGTNYDASVVRLNTAGSLDNSFDNDDGKIIYSIAGTDEIINAVNLQADGKIILTGKQKPAKEKYGSSFFAMRLTGDAASLKDNFITGVNSRVHNISLQQNVPNPFINSTIINYTLPQTYTSGKIIITNKNGSVIKEVNILGKGNGSLQINAATLTSGTYNYSLYADGKLMATKQMILTK